MVLGKGLPQDWPSSLPATRSGGKKRLSAEFFPDPRDPTNRNGAAAVWEGKKIEIKAA